jgi:hypothetical protein
VSGADQSDELADQLRALVEQELQRQGQAKRGALRVEGAELIVGRGAAEARADIRGTLAQWDNLPEDLRAKRIAQIAHLLAPAAPVEPLRRSALRASRPSGVSGVAPVIVVLLTVALLSLAYRYLAPNGASLISMLRRTLRGASSASSERVVTVDPDRERATLASSACGQTQGRITRGANIGPADVEGWAIELVLLRRGGSGDLTSSPAFARFVERKLGATSGVVIWTGSKSLAAAKRFDAQVEIRDLPSFGENHLNGIRLLFSGPYVVPYFNDQERVDYFMLADAMSEALQITDGALFAHCADGDTHQIGSWFLGDTPGAAVGSVIYFMAAFSAAPLLKPEILGSAADPLRRERAFNAISDAASSLDRSAAATLIGTELGMISGRPNQPTRITFPFRDANRATRASLSAARALKLANTN